MWQYSNSNSLYPQTDFGFFLQQICLVEFSLCVFGLSREGRNNKYQAITIAILLIKTIYFYNFYMCACGSIGNSK